MDTQIKIKTTQQSNLKCIATALSFICLCQSFATLTLSFEKNLTGTLLTIAGTALAPAAATLLCLLPGYLRRRTTP